MCIVIQAECHFAHGVNYLRLKPKDDRSAVSCGTPLDVVVGRLVPRPSPVGSRAARGRWWRVGGGGGGGNRRGAPRVRADAIAAGRNGCPVLSPQFCSMLLSIFLPLSTTRTPRGRIDYKSDPTLAGFLAKEALRLVEAGGSGKWTRLRVEAVLSGTLMTPHLAGPDSTWPSDTAPPGLFEEYDRGPPPEVDDGSQEPKLDIEEGEKKKFLSFWQCRPKTLTDRPSHFSIRQKLSMEKIWIGRWRLSSLSRTHGM